VRIEALTDDEIRELPHVVIGYGDRCQVCGHPYELERAHLRNVGMGGKRKKEGPRIWLCFGCHQLKLHARPRHYRLEVTTDGEVLWCEGEEIRTVGHIHIEDQLWPEKEER
jgi:hypothetical protein